MHPLLYKIICIIVGENFSKGRCIVNEVSYSEATWCMGHACYSFLLSVILGKPTIYHIPLFLAWFFIYLATYPFLTYIKQRRKRVLQVAIIYFLIAFLFGMISLLYEWRILLFVIVMIPLFIVNMYYARQK